MVDWRCRDTDKLVQGSRSEYNSEQVDRRIDGVGEYCIIQVDRLTDRKHLCGNVMFIYVYLCVRLCYYERDSIGSIVF